MHPTAELTKPLSLDSVKILQGKLSDISYLNNRARKLSILPDSLDRENRRRTSSTSSINLLSPNRRCQRTKSSFENRTRKPSFYGINEAELDAIDEERRSGKNAYLTIDNYYHSPQPAKARKATVFQRPEPRVSIPNLSEKFSPWEDFLASFGEKKDLSQFTCPQPDSLLPKIGVVAQTKYLPAARRRVTPLYGKHIQETPPPWHKIISAEKKSNRDGIDSRKKWEEFSKKHDDKLEHLKSKFHKVVSTNSKEIAQILANRTEVYQLQLESIELNCFCDRDMKRMRRKVNRWRQDMTSSVEKAPSWFEELKLEQLKLQLSNDSDVNEKMQSLIKYIDTKSSDAMKAKVCLTTFSLPIYDLCKPSMIRALKCVVIKILEIPEECLIEWLRMRNLVRKDWNLLKLA